MTAKRWRKPYSEHLIETPNGKPIYIQVRGDGRVIARCASVGPISANAVELIPEPDTPPRPPPPTDLTSDVVGRTRGNMGAAADDFLAQQFDDEAAT